MKKAIKSDKNKVKKIICESFNSNPHINYIIKNDGKRKNRMDALAQYAFNIGIRRNGVYLTDDEQGVAIVFRSSQFKKSLYEYWLQFCLVFKVFSVQRTNKICKLESLVKRNRENRGEYLYVWFLGVRNNALGTNDARELMKYVFNMSQELNLPLYSETTIERNNLVYKRFGFEDYNKLNTGMGNLIFYYMKRPVQFNY
jgi:hypothetical protein